MPSVQNRNQHSEPKVSFNCGHPFTRSNQKPDNRATVTVRCRECQRARQRESWARSHVETTGRSRTIESGIFPCGHKRSEANSVTSKTHSNRCRECNNAARKARRAGLPWVPPRAPIRASLDGLPIAGSDLAKKNPLDGLKMNIEQSRASDTLAYAIDDSGQRSPCESDPARWMDYDERTPPSREEAALMCVGCPFFEQCSEFADVLKPDAGVWAGRVWIDGKPEYAV
jgi:hypothetical protein